MKGSLKPHMVGLVLGKLFAIMHGLWALFVAMGMGQMLVDSMFNFHFLSNPYTVQPFNLVNAFILVVMTFVGGYVVGWMFATIWNWVAKMK